MLCIIVEVDFFVPINESFPKAINSIYSDYHVDYDLIPGIGISTDFTIMSVSIKHLSFPTIGKRGALKPFKECIQIILRRIHLL